MILGQNPDFRKIEVTFGAVTFDLEKINIDILYASSLSLVVVNWFMYVLNDVSVCILL